MLTLKTCFDAIDHKLGTDDGTVLDRLNIVNQAGAVLYAQPWKWLEAEIWNLSLEGGSDRVTLPVDLGELEDVWPADASAFRVHFCRDYGELQRMRSVYPSGSNHWSYTLAPFTERRDNQVKSYLAVWPVVATTIQNALLARGRRRWVAMADDDKPESAAIPLPERQPIFETLFIELVRAYAAGYERDGTTDMQTELARVMGGPLWLMAQDADMRAFGGSEPTRNTAVAVGRRFAGSPDGGDTYNGPQVWTDLA